MTEISKYHDETPMDEGDELSTGYTPETSATVQPEQEAAPVYAAADPDTEDASSEELGEAALANAKAIGMKADILGDFAEALTTAGVIGEDRNAKLLYLALTSRVLDRPVSIAVKGPSSGGKSFLTNSVLEFFPKSAYHPLTATSERALIYSEEPIKHRFLVMYEAAGSASEFSSYILRSLLSEGRILYETVEKTASGLKGLAIEREGPTGLLVTTTAAALHPENETRLLSITVTDTPEQTKDILRKMRKSTTHNVNFQPWQDFQSWISSQMPYRVAIPYEDALVEAVPPVAIRLRRDMRQVFGLIESHAILYRLQREVSRDGKIVASMDDYAAAYQLVEDTISQGLEATVDPAVRETVEAVRTIIGDNFGRDVTVTEVAEYLGLDKSAASRRVWVAKRLNYLEDRQDRKYQPAMLVVGNPMPEDHKILPEPGTF